MQKTKSSSCPFSEQGVKKKSPLVVSLCASVHTPQLCAIQLRASRATRRKRTIGCPFLRQWCGWLVSKVSRTPRPHTHTHTHTSQTLGCVCVCLFHLPPHPSIIASVALQKRFFSFFLFPGLVYYALSVPAQGLQHSTGLYWSGPSSDEPLRATRRHLRR